MASVIIVISPDRSGLSAGPPSLAESVRPEAGWRDGYGPNIARVVLFLHKERMSCSELSKSFRTMVKMSGKWGPPPGLGKTEQRRVRH